MSNNIVSGSFIAVSDFHGNDWPFDKVEKHYLNEYDKIFILGDATDRGLSSMELLLNIKNLSEKYSGRVIYVPGNHDQLLYDYAVYNDYTAKINLINNGGQSTIEQYENLRKNGYYLEVDSLMKWLGKLPLQQKHTFDGKKYAFAHAFFNQRLYDDMPDFCLDDLYKCKNNRKTYLDLMDIIWFRKQNDGYIPDDLPKDGSIVVIGHTPLQYREGQNLDLENSNGDIVKVHCVDGGIAYDGRMLKYDGGVRTISTKREFHVDTSPKYKAEIDFDTLNEDIQVLNDVIVDIMKNSSSREKAYLNLQKLYLTGNISKVSNDNKLIIKANLSSNKIKNIVRLYVEQRDDIVVESKLDDFYFDYVEDVSLGHVVTSLNERFGSKEETTSQICALFEEKDYTYITESVGRARTVAQNLGIDTMKKVIKKNGYRRVYDYVVSKSKMTSESK